MVDITVVITSNTFSNITKLLTFPVLKTGSK